MNRLLYLVIFLSLNLQAANQSTLKNEDKYNIKFKTFSFNYEFNDVFYLEGKDYKPLIINQNSLSNEFIYNGKPEIEIVQQSVEKPELNESELVKKNESAATKKLEAIGDEYQKVSRQLASFYEPISSQDREPNSSERATISEINSKLEELAAKMRKAEEEVAESNKRYLANINQANSSKTTNVNAISNEKLTPPKPKYEPLAKFTIPASGGNYILIFNKTPNGVTISPLNDAPGIFPFGSYQFINLSGTTVELRFGSKVISLSPNGRTVFKPETANGEYLEGEFWTKVDDEFKLGYKFRNLHISRIRTLAFIMPTAPGQSALNLKIAEERGQIEPPAPTENPKDKGKKNKEAEKKEPENRPFG
ncbi:MAG: hypothetical protein EBS00_00250 [Verrucomicrobia bacterium]|nr:hypothetical protein [Verrucomicrobiota bacterium]